MKKEARIAIGCVILGLLAYAGFNTLKKKQVDSPVSVPLSPSPEPVKEVAPVPNITIPSDDSRNSFGFPIELNGTWKSK